MLGAESKAVVGHGSSGGGEVLSSCGACARFCCAVGISCAARDFVDGEFDGGDATSIVAGAEAKSLVGPTSSASLER